MSQPLIFGTPLDGVTYRQRRAAYAIFVAANDTIAVVIGDSGAIGLPGGGSESGESPEATIVREIREELARGVRLVRKIGKATQYFYMAGEDRYYRMPAVFYLTEFIDEPTGKGEHEMLWLPLAEAQEKLFHKSHAWAAEQGAKLARLHAD
jgi:8-oxo-dGTP diphosphatase